MGFGGVVACLGLGVSGVGLGASGVWCLAFQIKWEKAHVLEGPDRVKGSQKCEAVPRRARNQGSITFVLLNSRMKSDREEEEEGSASLATSFSSRIKVCQYIDVSLCKQDSASLVLALTCKRVPIGFQHKSTNVFQCTFT